MSARAPERVRLMLITFGSVLEPRGGLAVRSRIAAESLAALGSPPLVVSTAEPPGLLAAGTPAWAREIRVPRGTPRLGFSHWLAREIASAGRESDVAIVANAMFWPALRLAGLRLPLVWDTNECQSLHYARLPVTPRHLAAGLTWRALEAWAAASCTLAVAVGEREAGWWRQLQPRLRDKLAIVDHRPHTRPPAERARAVLAELCGAEPRGTVFLFLGNLVGKHNAAAARWLLEKLAPALPARSTLVLAGPGTERLPAWHTPAAVYRLGPVDDVDSLIAAADVCLAPLASGAGVKTKVLHYLAHGRPVIGTELAFEGIEDAPGLLAAPLEELPAICAEVAAGRRSLPRPDPDEAAGWLEARHGADRVRDQWRLALARFEGSVVA